MRKLRSLAKQNAREQNKEKGRETERERERRRRVFRTETRRRIDIVRRSPPPPLVHLSLGFSSLREFVPARVYFRLISQFDRSRDSFGRYFAFCGRGILFFFLHFALSPFFFSLPLSYCLFFFSILLKTNKFLLYDCSCLHLCRS